MSLEFVLPMSLEFFVTYVLEWFKLWKGAEFSEFFCNYEFFEGQSL
jgi:hypothetical protein